LCSAGFAAAAAAVEAARAPTALRIIADCTRESILGEEFAEEWCL
jgi:hypothetical protein